MNCPPLIKRRSSMGDATLVCDVPTDPGAIWERMVFAEQALVDAVRQKYPDHALSVEHLLFDGQGQLYAEEFAAEPGRFSMELLQMSVAVRRKDGAGAMVVLCWENQAPGTLTLRIAQSIEAEDY